MKFFVFNQKTNIYQEKEKLITVLLVEILIFFLNY